MAAMMKYLTLCLLSLFIHTSIARRRYKKIKQMTSSIEMRIHSRRRCFFNRREEDLILSSRGKPMCHHKGRTYALMERIFDEDTCRACVCHAPDNIYCCEVEIVPTDIPKGCAAIEPWRRYRDWHRPGKCMAPLVMESSRGEICHDGRLTEKLRRSSLFLPERSFGDNPRILAHVNHKTNYRRHSGTKERHMLALRLREIIDNGVYRIPIFERSE